MTQSRFLPRYIRRMFLVVCAFAATLFTAAPVVASVTYTYDNLGRLATAAYDSGVTITYAYDINGNRMVQAITTNGSAGVWGTLVWGSGTWGG